MKPVEEALASRSFRRVVLPGIVLTIGFHPLISGVLRRHADMYGLSEGAVLVVAEIIFWGLVVSSAVNRVYYVYEGFSLPWITAAARFFNKRRVESATSELSALQSRYDTWSDGERERAAKLYEVLLDYPLKREADGRVVHYVYRANRLGNIIATYEQYAITRYGIDGEFYWFHFLQWAPAAAKADFDEQYDFAESLVLTSFAGAVIAIAHIITGGGFLFARVTGLAPVPLPISASVSSALILLGLAFCVIFYWLALPAHQEAGRIFRALVDAALKCVKQFIKTGPSIDSEFAKLAEEAHWYLSDMRSGS